MSGVRASGGGSKNKNAKESITPANEKLTKIEPHSSLRDEYAIDIWNTQSEILIQRGVMTLADAAILLVYCNSFSLYLESELLITKDGITVVSPMGGEKKHPAVNVRQDALAAMLRTGSLLGLDPLSRTKLLGGGGGNGSGDNEFSEFT
ncbi:phage terminase small subunit P27 family [Shewanella surugensis]|uniref:Phage terminase small subunit P27 family n=1 Tax=Shewanella surugensis TaxID=212020 RepID=A0ABT0LGY6_9GAMM|nr:phage terminase small subunit P27 family [Shewanella surugensis]MCL1126720.1 phage terminase small subunit P27 family [Shewanella surugensis]